MTQIDVQHVSQPEVARALRQYTDFLTLFVEPTSPTQAAKAAGMAPNLAHHHVGKLADLGLLFEQRREGGKVFYQLSAKAFRFPSALLPPEDEQGNGTADLRDLSEGFLRAYERSWRTLQADEEDTYSFGAGQHRPRLEPPTQISAEAFPAHLEQLTLRLSPERYRRLARQLSALLHEAAAEGHSKGGQPCTLAVLAFQSETDLRGDQLSHHINSFLGAE